MFGILSSASLCGSVLGNIQGAFACLGAGIGVGLVGAYSVDAVGRNPSKFGKIVTVGILGMALAEAVAFYGLFL